MTKKLCERIFFAMWVGIVVLWLFTNWNVSKDMRFPAGGDFQRETAIIYNIASGNILNDASYLGEHAYYPFFFHSIFAFVYFLTKIPIQTLVAKYSILVSLPAVVSVSFVAYKFSKSWGYVVLTTFIFLFSMPWTSEIIVAIAHPQVLAIGTLMVATYLFIQAVKSENKRQWILAGLGIATVIYSQIFAALTLVSGITLYQIFTRKKWDKFLLMVATSCIFVSPYVLPLLIDYHFTPKNPYGVGYYAADYNNPIKFLEYFLYGYGVFQLVNPIFIGLGIYIALKSKKIQNSVLLCLFTSGLGIEVMSLLQYWRKVPPYFSQFPPHDLQVFNHVIAIYLLVLGFWSFLNRVSKYFKRSYVLFLLFILIMGAQFILLLPRYFSWTEAKKNELSKEQQKEKGWYDASQWINSHTRMNDVFLATADRSYFYIAGMTGRKVVVTHNEHANTFVNQQKRIDDANLLLSTTEGEKFRKIAADYLLSYVVMSPEYEGVVAGNGVKKFLNDRLFQIVFHSENVTIYKLNW